MAQSDGWVRRGDRGASAQRRIVSRGVGYVSLTSAAATWGTVGPSDAWAVHRRARHDSARAGQSGPLF